MEEVLLNKYTEIAIKNTLELLSIDSPSGFTEEAVNWLNKKFSDLGYSVYKTLKGGLVITICDEHNSGGLLLQAHTDTLGGMVSKIKPNGRLTIDPIGGLNANNVETENVKVYTKFDKIYTGTFQLIDPSLHVNEKYDETKREWESMEIVLDEKLETVEDAKKIGIRCGDFVAFNPRPVYTESGFLKSRFLDDKLSVGIFLSLAQYFKDNDIKFNKNIFMHITVFEETGHGGSSSIPAGIEEIISVDMGCVGSKVDCTEYQVSIGAKDCRGPVNYEVLKNLIHCAEKEKIDYAVDVYPYYACDADASLISGVDCKHGVIGAAVAASHGYERTHRDSVKNTFNLLRTYICRVEK